MTTCELPCHPRKFVLDLAASIGIPLRLYSGLLDGEMNGLWTAAPYIGYKESRGVFRRGCSVWGWSSSSPHAYWTAMHELGHAAHDHPLRYDNDPDWLVVLQEVEAWEWAIATSPVVMSPAVADWVAGGDGFGGYLHEHWLYRATHADVARRVDELLRTLAHYSSASLNRD